jgi:hypothetical protein
MKEKARNPLVVVDTEDSYDITFSALISNMLQLNDTDRNSCLELQNSSFSSMASKRWIAATTRKRNQFLDDSPLGLAFQKLDELPRLPPNIMFKLDPEYNDIGQIGSGTYATVFHSQKLNINYAIKKIPWSPKDPIQISEIIIQSQLLHPNIIQVIEIFSDSNSRLNVVMDYCPTDLEKIIEKKYVDIVDIVYRYYSSVTTHHLHSYDYMR